MGLPVGQSWKSSPTTVCPLTPVRNAKADTATVWAPQLAPLRKIVFKIMFGATMLLIIIMWLCLPFYWGSCELRAQSWRTPFD